jgi:hypothetical protein
MLPPASAAAPPGLAPPRLNCIGGEKRGRGRERNEEKRTEEKKEATGRKKKVRKRRKR